MASPQPQRFQEVDKRGRFKDPNMYRTSYHDMCLGLEVCVKSDYPSGYGGHIPTLHHQLLFSNCPEAQQLRARASDPNRDSFGTFEANLTGVPYLTKHAKVKAEGPRAGFFPRTLVLPPWAIDYPQNKQKPAH
ncbi:hypothetical protein ACSSS7_004330 [Eimeria intestinalis]